MTPLIPEVLERQKAAAGPPGILLWPLVVVFLCALEWAAIEIASIPVFALRLISRNFAYRMLLGTVLWILRIAITGSLIVTLFMAPWREFSLWMLAGGCVLFVLIGFVAALVSNNLYFLGDVIFEESTAAGRYQYLKALREASEVDKPLYIERYFSAVAARDHIIRSRMPSAP